MIEIPKEIDMQAVRQVTCIVCAHLAEMKFSKKKKPYIFCGHCMTRYFLNSNTALAGYFLTTELLLPVVEEHKAILEDRVKEFVDRINEEREKRPPKKR